MKKLVIPAMAALIFGACSVIPSTEAPTEPTTEVEVMEEGAPVEEVMEDEVMVEGDEVMEKEDEVMEDEVMEDEVMEDAN